MLDRYGDVLVGQIATLGMEQLRELIEEQVCCAAGARGWSGRTTATRATWSPCRVRCALPGRRLVPAHRMRSRFVEAGLRFTAPLADGQKTGWFYDQTANRALLRQHLRAWRPGAGCVQLRGRLGRVGHGRGRRPCAVRGFLADGAGLGAAQCRGATGVSVAVQARRCLRCARSAACGRASASMCWWSIRRPSSSAARICPRARRHIASSTSWRCELARRRGIAGELLLFLAPARGVAAGAAAGSRRARRGRHCGIIASGGQSPDHPVHPAMPETRYLKALFCHVSR